MKNFWKSMRLTVVFCLFLTVCYIAVLWVFALVAGPGRGNAATVEAGGRVVGAANVGQNFSEDIYFWPRPSHAGDNGYDGSSSAGSNMGPTEPAHLAQVEERIDSFMARHPYLLRSEVPAEMVTASGSGLDPHISPAGAMAQVRRVAEARGMSVAEVTALVDARTEGPLLGVFGPAKVNVLKLNVDLDNLQKRGK